ncbi:modulator of FtsH protease HflC [Methylomarinovum tepidoasis]|uniref:Protein HflC n=1 Tax=Methylomarinovum tepidoasis TaxID=2840183 RepID=A0AAU9CVG1_9GAMM|nr:protease modulator HflC [Methylomarinovum sp. IN45]BCX88094.1 modulator of FtsH protease HflC [Methylomarinovum sp. IN45]
MAQSKWGLGLLVLLLFLGYNSLFTVHETEKAIKFRFGEIVRYDYAPGLHFKVPVPVWNSVKKFDARILTLDSKPERFLTSEKKNVIVDSFVKWRIKNVKTFYITVGGDPRQANIRLDQIIKDELRSEFGKRTIRQLVSTDREVIRQILLKATQPIAEKLGIEIIDIRIKRIDLPPRVSSSVYERMRSERARVAKEFRSQGMEAAERIKADADRQREVIIAEARRDAEKIRGEGDAVASDIYAKAYGKNEEFFAFYRSLNAYQKSFDQERDMIVLEPASDFFRYFKHEKPKR